MLALLVGCAAPMREPVPDDGELKIHYTQIVYFLSPGRDILGELWLMSKDGRYWVRAKSALNLGCERFLDAHTAVRIVRIWKRAAPLLEQIDREPDTGLDITSYSFEGYEKADVRAKMPPYDFEKVQEMVTRMWDYCRKGALTSPQAMGSSLRALERQTD
jgi:hypothetical protein